MKSEKGVSRRNFVKGAASAAVALSILPRRVLGGPNQAAPSEKVNLACIGMGYQGLHMLADLLKRLDVQVVAVCDPNTESSDYIGWGRGKEGAPGIRGGREVGREMVDAAYGASKPSGTYKGCKAYADFRELLETESGIDALHIVTPDHLHATIAIAAMKKGRHAATHKPISNVMHEVRLAVETAEKTGRATHLHAWHEFPAVYTVREWVRQGAIGPVREVHRWIYKPIWPQGSPYLPAESPPVPKGFDWDLWLGPVPHRPYSPEYTHAVFRGWYDFGGGCLADMGNYGLWLDWRVLDLGAPASAEGCASFTCEVKGYRSDSVKNEVSFPHASTIRFRFPAREGLPPCDVFWYDGGMRPPAPQELAEAGEAMPDTGVMFVGDSGKILAGYLYEKPRILPERKMREAAGSIKVPDVEIIPTDTEWIAAFRGGRPSRGSFQNARHLAEATCLGNLAVRLNARLEWDDANMKITNLTSANRYLRREYRPGWEL
jgi:hypothetical protein